MKHSHSLARAAAVLVLALLTSATAWAQTSGSGTDIADATIATIADQRWKGGVAVEPALTVTYNDTQLTLGTDYRVEFSNNTAVGTATATLTGQGNYTGTKDFNFNIADFPLLDPNNTTNSDSNPYLVATEADLQALACIVNRGARPNGYYKQTANITLTEEHTAIGKEYYYSFRGTYDGDDNTISGLLINKPDTYYQGLFGYTYEATIKNVKVIDCDITAGYDVGAIVGYSTSSSTIINCFSSGAIKTAVGDKGSHHGGICGSLNGTLDGCVSTVILTGNGTYSQYYGGLVGYDNTGSLKNSFFAGTVEGTEYVGSIIGGKTSTITNCYHTTASTGGVGRQGSTTGTDQAGAEVVAKISADTYVIQTLPEATYTWNGENFYKSGTVVTLDYTLPEGKFFDHYAVNSGEISNAATMTGGHTLTGFTQDVVISGSHVDDQRNLNDGGAIADIVALTFNGQVQQPLPVVTYDNETLVKDVNYTVSYSEGCTNADTYTVTVTGIGCYIGTLTMNYTINPLDISTDGAITVKGIDAIYGQTGSQQHPTPAAVTCAAVNNTTLVAGTDYTLSYSDGCTTPGNYTVSLTGQGNYTGTKAINFTILEAYSLTMYDGTETNEYVPLYGSFCDYYQKNEFVMPATGLTAMSGKVITYMQFYLSRKASSVWNGTFQVFMKEIEATTLSSYQGTDGATIVYEGSLDGTQDLMTVNFTTPYAYNGGNLLIGIYQTAKDNVFSASFYGRRVTGASIGGNDYNSLDAVSATQHNFLPKTTFLYESGLELADNGDNRTVIADNDGQTTNVMLTGRTIYKDGDWNTLTLPFDVTLAGSPLAGAEARTLENATLTDGTLDLEFGEPVSELTAGTPYIIKMYAGDLVIKTADDWNAFATAVAGGNTYEGKVVQLGADITVSTQVGVWKGNGNNGNRLFKGTFDGAGHTLTLNISGSAQGTAPFSAVQGATIMNLKTTGTVTLTAIKAYHASGLVGFSNGSTIKNCHVNASILFPNGTGTVHSGGIIGHALSAPFTMTDCLFDGTIGYVSGTGTMTNVGGLVGWDDASTPTITNCLNNGTFANPSVIAKIGLVKGRGTITNSYSTVDGTSSGDRVDNRGTYTTQTGSELATLLGSGWKVDGSSVVPVFGKYTATITNPMFANVTISKTPNDKVFTDVSFKGTYDAQSFNADNKSILFMGGKNTLYYPQNGASIGACRAYFQLNQTVGGQGEDTDVKAFVLHFGDGTETSISLTPADSHVIEGSIYNIAGQRLSKPQRGINIINGKKVSVK